ncbi:MAG: SMP-30/gluconolactonase/LRE family protein [Pirellulaceae bacterium]
MQVIDCEAVFRPLSPERRFLPEGPYDLGRQQISWVAIQHGADATSGSINILDLATGLNQSHDLPGRPGFAFPTTDNQRFVVGMERQVVVYDIGSGKCVPLVDAKIENGVQGTIINDGEFFDDGILFGCKDLQFKEAKAGLYLWRRSDRTLHLLRDDQICSNGKVLIGSDGQYRVFDIDSPTKQVVEYQLNVAAATFEKQRVVVDLSDGGVFPDGMIASPDGTGLIIALYNPEDAEHGEARQYAIETGELERVWRVAKSPQVTCPQLVVVDGRWKLFLTTAVEQMSAERQTRFTDAGSLFLGDTGWDAADTTVSRRFALEL